ARRPAARTRLGATKGHFCLASSASPARPVQSQLSIIRRFVNRRRFDPSSWPVHTAQPSVPAELPDCAEFSSANAPVAADDGKAELRNRLRSAGVRHAGQSASATCCWLISLAEPAAPKGKLPPH